MMNSFKKSVLISVIILATFALVSCNVTFDGYYYDLEDARNSEKLYDEYDYLFSVEGDGKIVDFIINGATINIIKIDCRGEASEFQYNIKSTWSASIEENIYYFQTKNEYHWVATGKFLIQVEYAIVSKSFNESHDNLEGFDFVYEDEEYCLCYKIGE